MGSGNWGSVATRIVGQNALKYDCFHGKQFDMHVHTSSSALKVDECSLYTDFNDSFVTYTLIDEVRTWVFEEEIEGNVRYMQYLITMFFDDASERRV